MDDLLDPDALYHLALPDEWETYRSIGRIDAPSLTTEGFIHCSWGRQVAGTIAKHFAGVDLLLALRIDPAGVADDLVEEDSYGSGQAFPHVYRPIPVSAVVSDVTVRP